MKILYGTSNRAKLEAMKKHLGSLPIELIGLNDLDINWPEVDESGNSPLENARIKALAYYQAARIPVFSCDSGLYIDGAAEEQQPGVHVRNVNGKHLSDDEMIAHYASLAASLGGNANAQYKNAICLVVNDHEMYEHMGDDIASERFILTNEPHSQRHEGFPLDSLSIHVKTGQYYYDLDEGQFYNPMNIGFQRFFEHALSGQMSVSFPIDHDTIDMKYVVIVARYRDQWVLVRHKDRVSYEIPGGHIEPGENYEAAAKRELYEETGAIRYTLTYVSPYSVEKVTETDGGYLFFCEIEELVPLPDSEIAEVRFFDRLPDTLTYPQIQPALFDKVQGWLNLQCNSDELWDVYDQHRNLTGRTHMRGKSMTKGDFHLVVLVWIMNSHGEFLITKRTPNKGYPNMWECTGGSALSGDTSLQAAVREVKEETGLSVDPRKGQLLFTIQGDNDFSDIWLFKQDFNREDIVFQENETCDAKWAARDEIKKMINDGVFVPCRYIDRFFELITSDN